MMTAKYFKYDEEYNLIPIYNDDVVEVVRCKDCKYCDGDDNCDDQPRWCERSKGKEFFVADNDYCSRGERK